MHVVVGLGNPGRRYMRTRHNIGFEVINSLSHRWNISAEGKQLGSLVGAGRIGDEKVLLAMPQKFMNRSGQPVRSLMGYFKTSAEEVVVVHDDLDLPFGRVQLKKGGGHGGHNGLRDLNKHVGDGYLRVRVGVGRPPEGWDVADYVLGKWTDAEMGQVDHVVGQACDAVETILRDGLEAAMNIFNVRQQASIPSC